MDDLLINNVFMPVPASQPIPSIVVQWIGIADHLLRHFRKVRLKRKEYPQMEDALFTLAKNC